LEESLRKKKKGNISARSYPIAIYLDIGYEFLFRHIPNPKAETKQSYICFLITLAPDPAKQERPWISLQQLFHARLITRWHIHMTPRKFLFCTSETSNMENHSLYFNQVKIWYLEKWVFTRLDPGYWEVSLVWVDKLPFHYFNRSGYIYMWSLIKHLHISTKLTSRARKLLPIYCDHSAYLGESNTFLFWSNAK
jgi:hypothetical protein